jgi:hypothetical protein
LLAALHRDDAVLAPPHDQRRVGDARQEAREPRVVHVGLPRQPRGHLAVALGDLELGRRRWLAEQLVPLRHALRIVHVQIAKLLRCMEEDVEDLAGLRPEARRRHQDQPVDRARAHRRHLGRRPAADRVAQQVGAPESGRIDEPEVEAREIVDPIHPLGVTGSAEARVRRCPHGVALGDPIHPAAPAAVAAGAVQHEQRGAPAADPGLDADTTDRDGLLTWSHAAYYACLMGRGTLEGFPSSPPDPRCVTSNF